MRKFLAALCSLMMLYAFVPTCVVVVSSDQADARGNRGGGRSQVHRPPRGGGHRASAQRSASAGRHAQRDHRATRDVNHGRNANVQRNTNRDRNVNRNRDVNRNRNVNRDVNRNVNRDINRDVDIDVDRDIDIDVHDNDWDPDGFWAGAAVATATAAVVGSIAYSLPPACGAVVVGGITYQQCGGVWYAPRYQGADVVYVVVDDPR
jgi:hypothetical protein